jgi:UDPglucose 6-dehydrogenase
VFQRMKKPAFAFGGRNILPHACLREIGFEVSAIGKPRRN